MATKTAFLQLTLPLNGEFQDTWDEPLNDALQKIDDWADSVNTELVDARFGQASLKEFLEIAHETDGSLKPTTEVVNSRSSFLYGDEDVDGDFDLSKRLNLGDKEVFWAREGLPSLRESAGLRSYMQSAIIAGAKDINGYPTWLGFTGANAQVDGSVDNILMLIEGQKARVRVLEQVTISGAAGTKYLYAQFQSAGVVRVDGDSTTPPPASPNGICGTSVSILKVAVFKDSTVDFTTMDVEVGDLLTILSGVNAGQYIIRTIAPDGDVNTLQIYGVFPGGALASIDYTISDPFAVVLGYDAVQVPAAGKLYIGEVDFDGVGITAARELHFNDHYVGSWQAVDVGATPQFDITWDHNLFDDKLEVIVQASVTNDGLQPIYPLDIGSLTNTIALNFSNTLVFSAGTFNPGSSGATYSPLPSLAGTVTSSLSGTVILDNAVRAYFTKTQVKVKNPVPGFFFRNYAGTVVTVGFVRVIVRRKA